MIEIWKKSKFDLKKIKTHWPREDLIFEKSCLLNEILEIRGLVVGKEYVERNPPKRAET